MEERITQIGRLDWAAPSHDEKAEGTVRQQMKISCQKEGGTEGKKEGEEGGRKHETVEE